MMTALLACAEPEPPAPSPELPPVGTGVDLVSPAVLPEVLSSTDGVDTIEIVGDLDGDGHADAIADGWVVRGPLAEPRVLPAGGWFALGPGGLVGDATGDGQVDLVWWHGDELLVLPGPIVGDPAPGAGAPVDPDVTLVDVDHDGVLDAIGGTDRLELRWGPADPSASPDLTASFCPPGQGGANVLAWVDAPGDLDGDGTHELVVATDGEYLFEGCAAFALSLAPGGSAPHDRVDGLSWEGGEPVGDLDGDGLAEVLVHDARLVASPIALRRDGVHGREVALPEELRRVAPLGHDLDGDGAGDLLATWLGDFGGEEFTWAVVPVTGGLAGLDAFDAIRAWELPDGPDPVVPYADDGVLHLLIPFEGGWRDATVGPLP